MVSGSLRENKGRFLELVLNTNAKLSSLQNRILSLVASDKLSEKVGPPEFDGELCGSRLALGVGGSKISCCFFGKIDHDFPGFLEVEFLAGFELFKTIGLLVDNEIFKIGIFEAEGGDFFPKRGHPTITLNILPSRSSEQNQHIDQKNDGKDLLNVDEPAGWLDGWGGHSCIVAVTNERCSDQ